MGLPNPHAHYRSGELYCEDVALAPLAERFGTPVYVYSQASILQNFRRLKDCLAPLSALACYSVKANSNLSILKLLGNAGAGFDVVSGGELMRVMQVQGNASNVVYSGVGKTRAEIDAALGAGILMFNVESAGELDLIGQRARALGRRAPIAIRVNPEVEAETHPYISTGQIIHKFGVPKAEAALLYRSARQAGLDVCGIACHIGSQILDVEPFLKAFDEIKSLAGELRSEGIPLQFLDLGGGFGIQYDDEKSLDFVRLARGLEARLHDSPYRLIVEPGRSIVGNAGLLLTRVLYIKGGRGKSFIVVDSGMNDLLRPALYGSFHEILPLRQGRNGRVRADVVGPLCETGDFLARDREMPQAREGDLLAVLTVGAYGYALASNYNSRPRPPEVLIHGNAVKLVRPRETVEELIRPEEL
ncbi:MAG: diaminopimelate decarboxylase [Terriglobia bacterium]